MYININDPEGENEKSKNVPQIISSLILGISASIFVFGIIFLATVGLIANSANGSESIISMLMIFWIPAALITLAIAMLVGLLFARIIYKKRAALLAQNSPNAQNREISLYILAALLVLVLCCLGGLALLITSG